MATIHSPLEFSGRFLLGVRFDAPNLSDARSFAEQAFQQTASKKIFTPNPEMLVKADDDAYFKTVLNRADLNLCDGRGTELALRYMFPKERVTRIAGSDFTLEVCGLAERLGKTVFLVGSGNTEIVEAAARNLRERFPRLVITGTDPGPELVEDAHGRLVEPGTTQALIEKIRLAAPDLLLVAFGMGKQEKWIHVHLSELPSVKIALGVGGTFSFLAGVLPRAPLWMRRIGLEWLFRLWQEPGRFKRIWRATVVFSWLIAREQYKKTES